MPPLKPDALLKKLAGGKPVPAILLLGADPYLRKLCRDKLIDTFVPEAARDWAVARFSAADGEWQEVFQRAATVPMLAPRQVVIVEEVEAIEELGDAAREAATKRLREYLDDPAPFTILVLEAARLDKRMALTKLLLEKAVTTDLEMTGEEAAALAIASAKEFGVELEPGAASLLVEAVNAEPARIRVELEKLSLYAQKKGTISVADVEDLVVAARKYVVWGIADILAEGRRDAALVFIDGLLRNGEQPPQLLGALATMYRRLIAAHGLPPRTNKFEAARQMGTFPDAAEQAIQQSRRFSRAQLISALVALANADSTLKSGVANPRAALEILVTQLAAPTEAIKSSAV
jgi:DNA polymerase-3 subunit delta